MWDAFRELGDALSRKHFNFHLISLDADNAEGIAEEIRRLRLDGLIWKRIGTAPELLSALRQLATEGLPVVCHGRNEAPLSWVSSDWSAPIRDMARSIAANGYRKVGIIQHQAVGSDLSQQLTEELRREAPSIQVTESEIDWNLSETECVSFFNSGYDCLVVPNRYWLRFWNMKQERNLAIPILTWIHFPEPGGNWIRYQENYPKLSECMVEALKNASRVQMELPMLKGPWNPDKNEEETMFKEEK